MVVAILGVLVSIAAPRFSRGQSAAALRTVEMNTRLFQDAIDRYMAEHLGRTPAHDASGDLDLNSPRFLGRLIRRTSEEGAITPSGEMGPYLRDVPINPFVAGLAVRIDTMPKSALTAWRFDSVSATITPESVPAAGTGIKPTRAGADVVSDTGGKDALGQPMIDAATDPLQ